MTAVEQKKLEVEQEVMQKRIERRIRQTNSLNRDELAKDIKPVCKNRHQEKMMKRKLDRDNGVGSG